MANIEVTKLLKELKTMYDMVLETYKYLPMIYTQTNTPSGNSTEDTYVISTHLNYLPNNSLLFILPRYTSQTDNVKVKVIFGDKKEKEYKVYLEDTTGVLTSAGPHSLVANRLAIFRFINGTSDNIILTNNPYYNTVTTSNLNVANQAVFRRMPLYIPESEGEVDGQLITSGFEFVLKSDFQELLNRVTALENRLVVGKEDIEEVKDELSEGQIYIQVEDFDV